MSDYSAEDEFYGRANYEGMYPHAATDYSKLSEVERSRLITGAHRARFERYEDPIAALHFDFSRMLRVEPTAETILVLAKRAYELGARAPKDGSDVR